MSLLSRRVSADLPSRPYHSCETDDHGRVLTPESRSGELGLRIPALGRRLAYWPGLPHNVAVILWLNGPFGTGKSSTAQALVRRLPRAVLFDPEPFGTALRHTVANVERGRTSTVCAAGRRSWSRLHESCARPTLTLIVPLTVLKAASADALAAGLPRLIRVCGATALWRRRQPYALEFCSGPRRRARLPGVSTISKRACCAWPMPRPPGQRLTRIMGTSVRRKSARARRNHGSIACTSDSSILERCHLAKQGQRRVEYGQDHRGA